MRDEAVNEVAVVVSAMGGVTDKLIAMAGELSPKTAPEREMDVLLSTGEQQSIALLSAWPSTQLGVPAVSITGRQAGDENLRLAHPRPASTGHRSGADEANATWGRARW